jgi:solute carrier family 10 (sodium/bile acid cotransporter), member 7
MSNNKDDGGNIMETPQQQQQQQQQVGFMAAVAAAAAADENDNAYRVLDVEEGAGLQIVVEEELPSSAAAAATTTIAATPTTTSQKMINGPAAVCVAAVEEQEEAATTTPGTTSTTTSTVVDDGPQPKNNNNNNNDEEVEENNNDQKIPPKSFSQRLCELYQQQEFLLWILAAIGLARAYPPLGAEYLYPDITSDWIAVMLIFLLSGISLRTSEIMGAVSAHWLFHLVVQIFSLGVVPAVVFGVSRALIAGNVMTEPALADGMVVCACLPMTINMVMVLTVAANGDEASALVGAVVGNGIGVVLSPLLILGYLGVKGNVQVGEVFIKLALRVLLPVIIGQLLQKTTSIYEAWYQPHKRLVTKLQQLLLGTLFPPFRPLPFCSLLTVLLTKNSVPLFVRFRLHPQQQQQQTAFIVYMVFCGTFSQDDSDNIRVSDVFLMILFQFLLLLFFMIIAWYGVLRSVAAPQRVMGLFGCTHKTVAIGIPLINAMYGSSSSSSTTNNNNGAADDTGTNENNTAALVALYALPLLVWHPLQLVLGTLLTPYLAAYVARQQQEQQAQHDNDEVEDDEEEDVVVVDDDGGGGAEPTTTTTATATSSPAVSRR